MNTDPLQHFLVTFRTLDKDGALENLVWGVAYDALMEWREAGYPGIAVTTDDTIGNALLDAAREGRISPGRLRAVVNRLHPAGFIALSDLAKVHRNAVLRIPTIGSVTLKILEDAMAVHGLDWTGR